MFRNLFCRRYVEHSSLCILYPYKLTFGILISTSVFSQTHILSLFRILSEYFSHKHIYSWSMSLYRSAAGFRLSFNLHGWQACWYTCPLQRSIWSFNFVTRTQRIY